MDCVTVMNHCKPTTTHINKISDRERKMIFKERITNPHQ